MAYAKTEMAERTKREPAPSKQGAPIQVYLDPDLKRKARALCVEVGVTWQEMISSLLKDAIEEAEEDARE